MLKLVAKSITVFYFLSALQAFAAFNCNTFSSQSVEQKRTEFTHARDMFIRNFGQMKDSDNSVWELARLLQQKLLSPSSDKSIFLADLPEYLLNSNEYIDVHFLKQLQLAIDDLENIGKCFHYQKRNRNKKDPLMALTLYDNTSVLSKNTLEHIFFGYTTSVMKNGVPMKVARGMDSTECSQTNCIINNIPADKAKGLANTHAIVRLIHNPVELKKFQHNVKEHPHEKQLTTKSWLNGITLYKYNGIFPNPEIYANVIYYANEDLIEKNILPLPWVTKKGQNDGNSLLLNWPIGSDQAHVVLIESDMDIPYNVMLDAAVGIGQYFTGPSPQPDSSLSNLTSIAGWLLSAAWSPDDYIGTAFIDRSAPAAEITTEEGSAVLRLQHEITQK